ncbi:MAG: hypothetical protein CV045_13660 [Cyanobacteria bacterium M5B4]|nr:MAG: hypothetical protein CV045_13660 [Cyanobacteria bacterium M5B4]
MASVRCYVEQKPRQKSRSLGKASKSGLKQFLKLENGIPSHDTFRRVFRLLPAEAFETSFGSGCKRRSEPKWVR